MIEIMYVLIVGALLLSITLLFELNGSEKVNKEIYLPFDVGWANSLEALSYKQPFKQFIDEDEKDLRTKDLRANINKANLGHLFTPRSFTTMKVAIMFSAVIMSLISNAIMNAKTPILVTFFNMNAEDISPTEFSTKIVVFSIFIAFSLAPNYILKSRVAKMDFLNRKDIPVIQLFVILMLRSKCTVSDVLFSLSKVNTIHRGTFETGYRIYVRNKDEGFDFLQKRFEGLGFDQAVVTLREIGDYSREDSILLLENNMEQIVAENNANKRNKDIKSMIFAQGAIAVPFVAIILLGIAPLITYGFSALNGSGVI